MQPDPRASAGWQQHPAPPVTGWWFIVPLVTFGLLTAPMVLAGAVKLRSRPHKILAGGYFAVLMAGCAASAATSDGTESAAAMLVSISYFVLWIVGTVHVAILASQVRADFFRNRRPSQAWGTAAPHPGVGYHPPSRQGLGHPPARHGLGHYPAPRPAWAQGRVDPALAKAQWRLARRAEARHLQATQPSIAAELMIGRPDLPGRQYDDGGLVDVNHAPAEWLMRMLSIERPLAERIVEARQLHNGFATPEELIVYCEGLTPAKLELFRDRLLFIPR
ncbi:helix-hairpin-helix domain-containing protein [Actinoplanes sp. NEAU-A12]|uniref:Helix-hairpin-helix domain-containing protein n=1 Tax=Actinoplanes sandaracinus TaxID=3045177 RepID=A0ABT6WNK1_9ACTN|nr:helix-hairpin-helix domain-containing protein [Actinoplanes sandaracinus]MDI6101275.1 helix-hairpin-helix domain-containing protein [Actinoplanes sandaracinus]